MCIESWQVVVSRRLSSNGRGVASRDRDVCVASDMPVLVRETSCMMGFGDCQLLLKYKSYYLVVLLILHFFQKLKTSGATRQSNQAAHHRQL